MKNRIITFSRVSLWVCLAALLGLWLCPPLYGQDEEEDGAEKKRARIQLEYIKITDGQATLKATVKTKVDEVYERVEGVTVHFFLAGEDEPKELGQIKTDPRGEALLALGAGFPPEKDSLFTYSFLAALQEEEHFQDTENDLEISEARFSMDLEEVDSLRVLRVSLTAPDSAGDFLPVPEESVKFFVKRLFGQLPIGDEYEMTDEDGMVELEFPTGIPGDSLGNLEIIAQVESDSYGTLQATAAQAWGEPVISADLDVKSKLWSNRANAPAYLIIAVNAVIAGIWGVIVYIIILLARIQKLGRSST